MLELLSSPCLFSFKVCRAEYSAQQFVLRYLGSMIFTPNNIINFTAIYHHVKHQLHSDSHIWLLSFWTQRILSVLSRPPQACSKFISMRKYQNRTDTSHSFPYMAIVWWLVNRGSERWGASELGSSLGGSKSWGPWLEVWTPRKVVF